MKKIILSISCFLFTLFGCVSFDSSSSVSRMSAGGDLSGYWNDTDVQIIADSLISDCVNAKAFSSFINENGRNPVVIVGKFTNKSDEHIDTSVLVKKFEIALTNSGRAEFVSGVSERSEIRTERESQQEWASEDSAKSLANEQAADYMLVGSVRTVVDYNGKNMNRHYYVYAELIEIETNKKVWMNENSDIRKSISKSVTRF